MPEVEKKTLSFRADPWVVDSITRMAEAEQRTIGAMIRIIVERWLAARNGRKK